jgi:hypothetical protein
VRPYGRDVPATPRLVEALEQLAETRRAPAGVPVLLYPLRRLLKIAGDRAAQRERRRRAAAARAGRLARKHGDSMPMPPDAAANVPKAG